MYILHVTTKACLPGWAEALLGLLLAFLLGWLLKKFMGDGGNPELEEENARLSKALDECRAGAVDSNALKGEVDVLMADLKGAKNANSLLSAQLDDAKNVPLAAPAPVVDTAAEDALKAEVSSLMDELKGAKNANELLRAELEDAKNATPMAAAAPEPVDPDDLTKIEGIGPKIAELCNGIGVMTFRQLSETSVEKLQSMLDDAGPRYRVHNPGSWPRQAGLAADGKWDELEKLQDELDGGK